MFHYSLQRLVLSKTSVFRSLLEVSNLRLSRANGGYLVVSYRVGNYRSSVNGVNGVVYHGTNSQRTGDQMAAEDDADERKKFEKYYKFQIQQKRLQEMSFSSTHPVSSTSSADQLMANIIQKVETDAKLDKRLSNSHHRSVPQQPVFNGTQVSMISSAVHHNSSHPFVPQYPNVRPLMPTQPVMTPTAGQPLNVGPNAGHLPQNNQSLKTTPILQQLFTDRTDSGYNYTNTYLPQSAPNQQQSMTSAANPTNRSANNANNVSVVTPPTAAVHRKLPHCFEDVSKTPALYSRVWAYVQLNDNLCDTNKLYPVLLSVGLPQQVLAQLWSVVNQTIPGQLTRPELSMALALIALLQQNCANPLDQIYKLDSLPLPTIRFFDDTIQVNTTSGGQQPQSSANVPQTRHSDHNIIDTNKSDQNFSPNFGDTLTAEAVATNDDDFDDFKSADVRIEPITSNIHPIATPLPTKQSTELMMGSVVSDVIDDDFADFKSADFNAIESHLTKTSSEMAVNELESKLKKQTLSDAVASNITAMSLTNSPRNLTPTPVFSISLVNSWDHSSGPNTLESSPDSIGVFDAVSAAAVNSSSSADRYNVFRELMSDTTPKAEDFGNFLSHTTANFDTVSVDSLQFNPNQDNIYDSVEAVSHQMIQTCRQLIHKAFNVLIVSHGEDSAVEAIRAANGLRFAFDLLEVYAIVKRLDKSLKASDKLNDNITKLIDDIDSAWNTIGSLFAKASIDIELKDESVMNESESSPSNTGSLCTICCSKATADRPVIPFAGFDYHTSCANLWLNCINPSLPQPIINCR
ncbi:unnamed protein product [Medioppia subpectinata]|uniref:EH domain-containing protein n=1 Tax=Medioppia subpectinata TaxID=1979941 RepID=A0A7R9KG03_9ACAR|nr:unnamed protein product [Medioppia subpectinata]CAG2102699.1 unnamed protein product [Medioppia subpectinata]